MNEQLFFAVNIDRCWGCKSCQTACKTQHDIPSGVEWPIEVFRLERTDTAGKLQCDFIPVLCQHCDDPACMEQCPVSALYRDEDGFVQVDKERCIACGACQRACPYGAVTMGESCAVKCDACAERRGRGMEPSCVQHCSGDALCLADAAALAALTQGAETWSAGRVVYYSKKIVGLFGDERA